MALLFAGLAVNINDHFSFLKVSFGDLQIYKTFFTILLRQQWERRFFQFLIVLKADLISGIFPLKFEQIITRLHFSEINE